MGPNYLELNCDLQRGDVGKKNVMGEWRRWRRGARGEGERGPVSDKGRYDQVITSDKIEEEKVECWEGQKRERMTAVRGIY